MDERAPHVRFLTEARERTGLSVGEAAERMGISHASLWDLETYDDELEIYSLQEVDRFCQVLGTRLDALFNMHDGVLPLSAEELVNQIREHCRSTGITVEQFEDRSGVWVAHSLGDPASFYTGYALDAIRDICAELGVDWRRLAAAYRPAA